MSAKTLLIRVALVLAELEARQDVLLVELLKVLQLESVVQVPQELDLVSRQ